MFRRLVCRTIEKKKKKKNIRWKKKRVNVRHCSGVPSRRIESRLRSGQLPRNVAAKLSSRRSSLLRPGPENNRTLCTATRKTSTDFHDVRPSRFSSAHEPPAVSTGRRIFTRGFQSKRRVTAEIRLLFFFYPSPCIRVLACDISICRNVLFPFVFVGSSFLKTRSHIITACTFGKNVRSRRSKPVFHALRVVTIGSVTTVYTTYVDFVGFRRPIPGRTSRSTCRESNNIRPPLCQQNTANVVKLDKVYHRV